MDRLLCDVVTAVALLLCVAAQVLCQRCPQPCHCPAPVPPQCPPGVPLLMDGCQCCQVCARQRGEACSDLYACDGQRGLQCDYSASFPGQPGECVSQEELTCELNGVTYQDGQAFQPSCRTRCRCQGGGVTCVPLCPLDVRLAGPDCPHPQQVQPPGKCCREWVCEILDNSIGQHAMTAPASRTDGRLWPLLPGLQQSPTVNCIDQSTEWSACSRTCGAGVSTRVSNQNAACRLELQSRLCKVRPCRTRPPHAPLPGRPTWRGGPPRCESSYQSLVPVRLVHQGCYSARVYRPRYCGECTGSGCCTPYRTSTARVSFLCPSSGRTVVRPVMAVHSCVCHYSCPYGAERRARWG